jgi:LacI family transcriptional regulator
VLIMSEITQEDIAKALNLSRETVTKALQDHPKVAQRTKALVRSTAVNMGYIPNFYAKNLAVKKTKYIGIIIPKISHSFHSSVVELMYKYAVDKGYGVLPMISFEEKRNELRNLNTLVSMRVDGIIANVSQDSTDNVVYKKLRERGIPIVFFDRFINDGEFCRVTTSDRKISCEIVSDALSKGYSKPAHLAGYSHISIGRERRNGFIDALNKHNISINADWIIEGGLTDELRYENAKRLLSSRVRPDLFYCFNDSIAQCVYRAASELNLRIPKDVGVIGFGNLEVSTLMRPKLSTVALPIEEIASNTVNLLLERIENSELTKCIEISLNPRMILRESY